MIKGASAHDEQLMYKAALQNYYHSLAHPSNGIPCQELRSGMRIFSGNNKTNQFFIVKTIYGST